MDGGGRCGAGKLAKQRLRVRQDRARRPRGKLTPVAPETSPFYLLPVVVRPLMFYL